MILRAAFLTMAVLLGGCQGAGEAASELTGRRSRDLKPDEFLHAGVIKIIGTAGGEPVSGDMNCSATLICPNVVLTAAHCVTGFDRIVAIEFFLKQLGSATRAAPRGIVSRVTFGGNVEVPDQWRKTGIANYDVALLKLDAPMRDLPSDRYPKLADAMLDGPGAVVTPGFGRAVDGADARATLGQGRYIEMRFDSYVAAPNARMPEVPKTPMIKTLPGPNDALVCQGDSGGGLFGKADGLLYGVVSNFKIQNLPSSGEVSGFDRSLEMKMACTLAEDAYFTSLIHHRAWLDDHLTEWCPQ